MKIIEYLKAFSPPEIKRATPLVSMVLALILVGFLGKVGEKIFDAFLILAIPLAPEIFKIIRSVAAYTIPININLLSLLIFILLFFPAYRFFDRNLLSRLKKAVIFEDDFDFGNKGWRLNYWHSNNADKTCRIEQSAMIFEAEDSDLISPQKENGACFDLEDGIYQNSKYEISCWVKADKNSTIGFKLWVHDTRGQGEMKFPANFYTPGTEYEEVKVGFIATKSQALRIHLHYKAGKGKISVDRVRVPKV